MDKNAIKPIEPKMIEKLLRPEEVSDILRLSKSQTYSLIRSGELTSVRIRHSVRVRREDLENYIKNGLRNPQVSINLTKNTEVKK